MIVACIFAVPPNTVPAKLLIQDVDMGNAVQEWKDIAVRCHGGRDCCDCSVEIICLAGKDHRVIDRRHLRRDHRFDCYFCAPERALDPQPLLGKTLAPCVPDEKPNIGSALGEAAAEAGEFPTQIDPEYPMSEIARDFYREGPSFLNRYLPFWMTSYAKRAIAMLVAIFAIVLPVFIYVPKLYRWYFEERMLKLYRRLRTIETELHSELSESQITDLQRNLESLDTATGILGVPNRFSDLFFSFKIHINFTRTRLASRLIEVRGQKATVT